MVELVPGTYAVDVGENPNNPFLAENWDGVNQPLPDIFASISG